ncbi:hypothetical protein Ae201684_003457 [Aphanomyces euteiches]|uniref:Uncharacterized protein n=1 Tax=Aphanomyces euteiches TaxID=100861 RepID=A0A6G0XLU1_9STRA|nr:hypothetical protein Ae201684_003457 [Aphanomyces euteiches]
MTKRFRENSSTDSAREDVNSSVIHVNDSFAHNNCNGAKKRRISLDLMMALQDVLDTYGRDDFDTTMTFSTKLGSASDHTLACWGRNAQVPLSIVAIVIESSYFPIQKCMFQALCRILRALVNGNFQFEFDKIHKSLPAVICDLLPSLDHDTDRIEPLNVRDRLNILNNTLQKVFSFRIRKCWIQEGSGKPRRLGTDGWIDLGERVLSFYRDDEKSSIVCLPYSQISDIRFNTNQNFARLFFKQGIIVSAGFAFDEEDYLTFRSCIQQCYLRGNAIEGGKVWHFGTISDSTSNVDNGFDDFDALEVTRVPFSPSPVAPRHVRGSPWSIDSNSKMAHECQKLACAHQSANSSSPPITDVFYCDLGKIKNTHARAEKTFDLLQRQTRNTTATITQALSQIGIDQVERVRIFETQTALPQLSCNIQDHLKEFGDESELVMTESLRHIKRAVDRCNKSNYGSCLITTSMITFVIVAVSWSIVCRLGLLASIGQL